MVCFSLIFISFSFVCLFFCCFVLFCFFFLEKKLLLFGVSIPMVCILFDDGVQNGE